MIALFKQWSKKSIWAMTTWQPNTTIEIEIKLIYNIYNIRRNKVVLTIVTISVTTVGLV